MAFLTIEDRSSEIECVVFPKTLSEYAHLLRADNVVMINGAVSLREDENPKILASDVEELPDNERYEQSLATQKKQAEIKPSPAPKNAVPANPKILYLRIPSFDSEEWKKARTLLDIFEGELPVSVFDSSDKTYHKQPIGFDCTPYTLGELQKLLGLPNVVLK